jgi:hypothetical protein
MQMQGKKFWKPTQKKKRVSPQSNKTPILSKRCELASKTQNKKGIEFVY